MAELVYIGAKVTRDFWGDCLTLASKLTAERRERVDLADLIREALAEKLARRREEEAGDGHKGEK